MKIWGVLAVMLLCMGQVEAHHGEALFDYRQTQSVSGTVKAFLWANPHVRVSLEIADARGTTDVSAFEAGSVGVMQRNGWSRQSLVIGDKLAITYHPLIHDKKPGGMLISAMLADGRVLSWQPPTP